MLFKEIVPPVAIRCPVEEEAIMLMEELERLGYEWLGHERPTRNTYWNMYKEDSIYVLIDDRHIAFPAYKERGSTQCINFLDIVVLEPGDVVCVRDDLTAAELYDYLIFLPEMEKFIGADVTIRYFEGGCYLIEEDNDGYWWNETMFAGAVRDCRKGILPFYSVDKILNMLGV